MKFISKSSNLLIVLRPGFSAQPLTGTPAVPSVSVRFKDGVANVESEELVQMMLKHPGFNGDYIAAEPATIDPYASQRVPTEPAHILTELKFGTPVSREVKGGKAPALPPELQKLVVSMASDMAKQMVPELLKSLVAQHESGKPLTKAGKPKGKPGRKPKVNAPVSVASTEPEVLGNPATQASVS